MSRSRTRCGECAGAAQGVRGFLAIAAQRAGPLPAALAGMERKLVTCPETAHLEQIAYESTPCGTLIMGCSRFHPDDAVECARECAARLDRRSRADTDEVEVEIEIVRVE